MSTLIALVLTFFLVLFYIAHAIIRTKSLYNYHLRQHRRPHLTLLHMLMLCLLKSTLLATVTAWPLVTPAVMATLPQSAPQCSWITFAQPSYLRLFVYPMAPSFAALVLPLCPAFSISPQLPVKCRFSPTRCCRTRPCSPPASCAMRAVTSTSRRRNVSFEIQTHLFCIAAHAIRTHVCGISTGHAQRHSPLTKRTTLCAW